MKYWRFIFFALAFLLGITWFIRQITSGPEDVYEPLLKNGVVFKGVVLKADVSNNHAFGVLHLKVVSSSVSVFNKKASLGLKYPYQIRKGEAELYAIVADIEAGDTVAVNSDKQLLTYHLAKSKESYQSDLFMVRDPSNIEYMEQYTAFK
ncbi:hypothetical protein C8P68_102183 [Mucilaginibacter yixingensis]|uniref:Uncharacterized protein n=1 Tax=Mucilaginibacter yixingensis TaxID=1295612 RepID=A0A2T5JC68_9SPHI|nr:hypothetical protein [Mucilaginibacter yixingensis]PTQ99367.1 hypothetical protein C8P68_102183 [Mucilaginibacter yixingensis]